jgi:hypothetical protein
MTDNKHNTVEIAMYEFKDLFDFVVFFTSVSIKIQNKKHILPIETLFQVSVSVYNKAVRKFVIGASENDIKLITIPDSIVDGVQEAQRYIASLNKYVSIEASQYIDEADFQSFAKNEIKLYFSKLGIKLNSDKSVFGKIAFAPGREDIPDEMYEDNTAVESDVFDALYNHVGNNIKLSKSASGIIKNILLKGKYSDMFVKPKTEYVYRGMRLKYELSDKIKQSSNFVFLPKDGTSSSWTSSISVAENFADFKYNKSSIVLIASVLDNSNSFLDLINLYDIRLFNAYAHEKEVIGLGPITVKELIKHD